MQRRTVLSSIVIGLILPARVLAQQGQGQGGIRLGQETRQYLQNTLEVGGLSLATSLIAQEKANNAWVKRFANYEASEQEGIANVFRTLGGMPPAPQEEDRQAPVRELRDLSGGRFEETYLQIQHDGHEKLLHIQEDFIRTGQDPMIGDMAKLIANRVEEHLNLIDAIRAQLRYARR